jgi:hypothetical protein
MRYVWNLEYRNKLDYDMLGKEEWTQNIGEAINWESDNDEQGYY